MKHIEVALPSIIEDVDPMKMWSYYHFMIAQSLFSTLVRINEEGKLVSHLASRWHVSEDGKKVTIFLDKKAQFSDGTSITSSDVVFSLARHIWPDSPSVIKGYLLDSISGLKGTKKNEIPKSLKVINDHQLEIHLDKPYAPFMHLLAMPGFSIISAKKLNDITCGPMTGSYNSKNKKWELEASKNYFVDKSKMRSMNIRAVNGKENIQEAFRKKEIDIILGIPIGEATEMKLPKDVIIKGTDTLSFNHFFYNTDRPFLKKRKQRELLGRFIQDMAWQPKYLNQFQEKLTTYLPKGVMDKNYYARKLSKSNTEKLKALVGKKQKLKVVVVNNHFDKEFLDELKRKLDELGFVAELVRAKGKDFMSVLKSNDYDIVSGPYIGNFPDPDGFLEPIKPHSAVRVGNFEVDEFLSEIGKIRHEKDSVKRILSYSRAIRKLEDEWNFIPLYRINFPIIYQKELQVPDSSYRYEAELWNIFWN